MAVVRSFLILWIFLFTQVFASQEFVRNARGTLIINSNGQGVENYRQTRRRLNTLGLTITNTIRSQVDGREARELASSIRQDILRLSSRRNPSGADLQRIASIREKLRQFEGMIPLERLREIYDRSSNYGDDLRPEQLNDLDDTDLTEANTPGYCSNYSLLDRETMEGFYRGAQSDEGEQCYDFDGNHVGLDLSSIGEAMISLEDNAYQSQSRRLKNGLIKKSVKGILEESQAYSGLFPGVDNNLERLKECSSSEGRERMGNSELNSLVDEYQNNLPGNIEHLNNRFGGEETRKKALIANQVRQALIIGNLFNVTSRARERDGSQIASVGGTIPDRNFTYAVVNRCQQRMVERYNFFIPEFSHNGSMSHHFQCVSLVENGTFSDRQECLDAYVEAMQNPELQDLQQQCFYRESGRDDERPRTINADKVIPLMSSMVDSNPLLFDRRDNRNLIPFMSSESDYRPSGFANNVMEMDGASAISSAVLDLLETNPDNPAQAISELLDREDMKDQLSSITSQAQENDRLKNSLKDEVESYQDELAESAAEVCENDGRHLHQFPTLVNDVISEEVASTNDPSERQTIVARLQAAQCWMLHDDPPEETGGLSAGMIGLGVGMIALGFIPVVGWAAAAGLMAGGSGIIAMDAWSRNNQAQNQLRATEAAFYGGWSDTNQLLLTAARATDANTNAWVETLSFGVLDVGAIAFRVTRGAAAVADTTVDTFRGANRVEDVFEAGERTLRNCTNCSSNRLNIADADVSHAREHVSSLDNATNAVRSQMNDFEELITSQLRGIDEIQTASRAGDSQSVGRIGEMLESLNLSQAELNTLRTRINGPMTQHRMGLPSSNWIVRLKDPEWVARLNEDQLAAFYSGLEEGLGNLRNFRVEDVRGQITDSIIGASGSPFRRSKITTLYPDGVSPDSVLRGLEDIPVRRSTDPSLTRADDMEVLDFERGGVGYRMLVCRPQSGNICRRTLSDGTVETLDADRLITVYPRCQPNVNTLRNPRVLADEIISGTLSGGASRLDLSSLILEPVANCR